MKTLSDRFGDDPMTNPLVYPGRIPEHSGLLLDGAYLRIEPRPGRPPGEWAVKTEDGTVTVDRRLRLIGGAPVASRHCVAAVGSNASPSQMHRKFAGRSVRAAFPMLLAEVHGISPGVSAHISRWGYIPATPVVSAGRASRLFLLWLDDEQLTALDATEPNYHRRLLPGDGFPAFLESGDRLPACFVYVGKHGCLTDEAGSPWPLRDQASLIQDLLDSSPALRSLCGSTPSEFLDSVRNPATREAAYRIIHATGRVRRQPELSRLPRSTDLAVPPGAVSSPPTSPS